MSQLKRKLCYFFFGVAIVLPVQGYAAPGVLADQPLYLSGGRGVPANLVFTPSVEFPTVESVANTDDQYSSEKEFAGYFSSDRCYTYNYAANEGERYFSVSSVSASQTCSGAGEWSGNFLNWAATQTIDPFRKVLTGGYRAKDDNSGTWLEKARHPGDSGTGNYPIRVVTNDSQIQGATPFNASEIRIRIHGLGSEMRFSLNGTSVDAEDPEDYNPGQSDISAARAFEMSVRVEVCNPNAPGGVEPSCVEYPNGNWKPEGLIQKNADRVRYSVFGYLLDSSKQRDGGVLRAAQKFVGPQVFNAASGGFEDNPNKEWDPQSGILIQNPNPDDAQATSSVAGVTINNSGVINYINKFGQTMVPGAPFYEEIKAYVATSGSINFNKRHDPVSELYYAATRYLKNQGNVPAYSSLYVQNGSQREMLRTKWLDGFPVITDWQDPIQYECQPNAILGIGDTNTGQDKNLPGSTSSVDEPEKPDEVRGDTTVDVVSETNRVGIIESGNATSSIGEGDNFNSANNSAYIAGLAYNNHVKDIRPEASMPGKQTVSTHWVDVAEFQTIRPPLRNQYYLAAKYGGFEVPDDFEPDTRNEALPESWWTSGETVSVGGTSFTRPNNYYVAAQANRMIASLENAFENIIAEAVGSSTGLTFNTATLETDTLLFGARFDSSNWTGDLFATGLTENESGPPTIDETETWEAGNVLDSRDLTQDARQIITYNGVNGLPFNWTNWANFTTRQQNDLKFDGATGNLALAENRVSYLRGNEVTGMRNRASLLGDIVNSTPVYVAKPDLGWPTGAPFGTATDTYAQFRSDQANRTPVVYVGANDGMLHAFRGTDGKELFGYIPEFLFSDQADAGLHFLTLPSYQHRYYVDLTPVVSDVYTQGAGGTAADWRTIVIGGARTGGKGVFALDVTNPANFSELNASSLVMWEFSSADDSRMGYIIEPPTVSLVQWGNTDFRWTAFVPNGYNSTGTSTGLFMLDIEGGLDGDWTDSGDYRYIQFDAAADATGLSSVRQVDLNGDRVVDRVYAGDLKGNIWVAADSGNGSWASAYRQGSTPKPLFTAVRSGTAQPITAAPMVVRNPNGNENNPDPDVMVLFGTGQYLTQDDTVNEDVQSFYGVLDQGTSELDRSDLVSRTVTDSVITVENEVFDVRSSSGEDFDTQNGWYVDFTTETGERIVQPPQVRGEYVFVNSTIPSSNPCDVGGSGWLMAFGLDGQTPDRAVWPKLGAPYVGFKTKGGLPNKTGFLGDYALIPRSDSEILSEEVDVGSTSENTGRMSWQELYD